jgi:hypothetical protein
MFDLLSFVSSPKPPVFSTDPIPPALLPSEISVFVSPIDIGVQPDPDYIAQSLLPHFKSALAKLRSTLADDAKASDDFQQEIRQSVSPDKYKINFVNRDLYRKWRVIAPEFERARQALFRTRLSLLSTRKVTIENLIKLAEFLIVQPRSVYINYHYVTQPFKILELQCLNDVMTRYSCYHQSVTCLELQLQIISTPFDSREANLALLRRLIDESIAKFDPETSYLPETEEYRLFAEFLLSAASPYRLPTMKLFAKGDLLTMHDQLVRSISGYVGLLAGHLEHVHALKQMCVRFLFDFYGIGGERSLESEKVERYIHTLATATVSQLDLGDAVVADEFLHWTAADVAAVHPILASAAQDLVFSHFLNNPLDLLSHIRAIEGQLVRFVAEGTGRPEPSVRTFDALFAAWKLLFVVAQIPDPQRVFDFIAAWKKLDFVPNAFVAASKVPRLVLKRFLTGAMTKLFLK